MDFLQSFVGHENPSTWLRHSIASKKGFKRCVPGQERKGQREKKEKWLLRSTWVSTSKHIGKRGRRKRSRRKGRRRKRRSRKRRKRGVKLSHG